MLRQAQALGDELMLQRLLSGARDTLTCALWTDDPGTDHRIGEASSHWELTRGLLSATLGLLVRGSRPVVQVRLPALGPAALAEFSLLFLHAAMTVAIALDTDPLAVAAVARWRAAEAGLDPES